MIAMGTREDQIGKMADLIFTLRQKCALKDLYFVKKTGITTAEYNCLIQFYTKDNLSMKELSERLDITPGGVTRIVASLEGKNIVRRKISPEDRRGIKVTLTKKGNRIVREMREASLEVHKEILSNINPKFREPVLNAIELLIKAINHWLEIHRCTRLID